MAITAAEEEAGGPGALAPSRGSLLLGALLVLAAVALNKWTLEPIFARDETISSPLSIAVIVAFQLVLLTAGVLLLLKRPALPGPAALRYLAMSVLAAGVLLGGYGTLRATGVIDPHRETRGAWATMAASEELIFELTPQFKVLAASLNNLAFPDGPSQPLFEPRVAVIDLVPPSDMKQVANLGIEVPQWTVAKESRTEPVERLQLWRAFMDRADYVNFPWTEFKAAKAQFLDPAQNTFEINLVFQGVGRLKSGGWVWIKAANEVRWRKQPAVDAKGKATWRIYEWRTTRFSTMERNELLFGEVLDAVVPPESAEAARRSIHEELRLAWMLDKAPEKERKVPHKHFTLEGVDRHPGLAIVDLDRDGFDDLYFVADYGKNMFFRNLGNGRFEEISAKLGLDVAGHGAAALFADFDNDGHLDVFIGRTLSRSRYLRQENGRFVDRSDWIKGQLPYLASSVTSADYDGDGLLDVYIATYASNIVFWERQGFDAEAMAAFLPREQVAELQRLMKTADNPFTDLPGPPNVLLRNTGRGRFEVVQDTPLAAYKNTYQATWGDFDADGKPDIFLANDFSQPTLYRNLGGGKFADVTAEMGLASPRFGMGATWGDYDNDGRSDLYVSAMSSKAGRRILAQLPNTDPRFGVMAAGNALYRNTPGRLEKTSGPAAPQLTVEQSGWDYGAQLVDLNNDGWLDIFSLSGYYTAPKQVETDFDL